MRQMLRALSREIAAALQLADVVVSAALFVLIVRMPVFGIANAGAALLPLGLTAALAVDRLQAAGVATTVFESRDKPGGRAYVYEVGRACDRANGREADRCDGEWRGSGRLGL